MRSERSQNLKLQKTISAGVIVMGIILLIYMVIVENEPGALPLFMIVLGTGWYFFAKSGLKTLNS